MSFSAPNVDPLALTIDVAHLQGERLRQAQAHGIGHEQENPVAEFAGGTDQFFHFGYGENIRQGAYFGGFNDIDPLPVALKNMFPVKLLTVTVDFDGVPGMGFHQLGKIVFPLFQGQLIRVTVKKMVDIGRGRR